MPGSHLYVSDGSGQTGEGGYYVSWMDEIYPYIKSVQIFVCPSATAAATTSSYGYNPLVSRIYDNKYGISLAGISRPSEIVTIEDANWYYGIIYGGRTYCLRATATGTNFTSIYHHLDGWNLAFADGHVKWKKAGAAPICDDIGDATTGYYGQGMPSWDPTVN